MDNSIWGKRIFGVRQQAYGSSASPFKIRGVLLDNNSNNVKIDLGNNKIMEAHLRNQLNANIGEKIQIEKKEILHSKIYEGTKQTFSSGEQEQWHSRILKELGLTVTEDSVSSVEILNKHGLDINKENIISFINSKKQLDVVIKNLDYNTAVKLMEKDIDLEKGSLQEIARALGEVKHKKEPFSFLKLFKLNKELSAEEAEMLAYKIYGSKMGKDITDIIKALHKADMEINKNNIGKLNNIFTKLNNLQNIKEDVFAHSIKNNIGATIDNLYKLENAVEKNIIPADKKAGTEAARVYENLSFKPGTISERDLKLLDEDIKEMLKKWDMKPTEENIRLSRNFIRNGVELNRENILKALELKAALAEIRQNLNSENIALLLKAGISVEKTDIRDLANIIRQKMLSVNEQMEEMFFNKGQADEILKNLQSLGTISDRGLLQLLKYKSDFKIINIKQILSAGGMPAAEPGASILNEAYNSTLRVAEIFKDLKNIQWDAVSFQINNKLPLTLEGIHLNQKLAQMSREEPVLNQQSAVQAKVSEVNGQLQYIKENLSSMTVLKGIQEGIPVERMLLSKLEGIIKQEQMKKSGIIQLSENEKSAAWTKSLIDNISSINSQKNGILSLMLKNAIPITMKEVQKLSMFLKNQNQIAYQINEMLGFLEESSAYELKKTAAEIKEMFKQISQNMKDGTAAVNKIYEDINKAVRELLIRADMLEDKNKLQFSKNVERLLESIEIQNLLNKGDTVFQLPFAMNRQLKNLQIYIMDQKKGSKKIDPDNMSVFLNFDTEHMGNINIYVAVNHKKVTMNMGVKSQEDKKLVQDHIKNMQALLEVLGYELKEMTFRVDSEQYLLAATDDLQEIQEPARSILDVRI